MVDQQVANPGSALGEAIGAMLEVEIHRIMEPVARANGCVYVTAGAVNPRTGKDSRLVLTDNDGNDYNVDAVIINKRFQPLVLIESKYIRYKKHNRDKASWVCTAHTKLRQRYVTVRKSIAVLMGSWSKPSKRLLESFEVELFEVSFDDICDILSQFGIDYRWAEKDRKTAMKSWQAFCRLSERERKQIARRLIAKIEGDLRHSLETAMEENIPRTISSVRVVIRSNRGETFTHVFDSLQQALDFMQNCDPGYAMDTSKAPALLS